MRISQYLSTAALALLIVGVQPETHGPGSGWGLPAALADDDDSEDDGDSDSNDTDDDAGTSGGSGGGTASGGSSADDNDDGGDDGGDDGDSGSDADDSDDDGDSGNGADDSDDDRDDDGDTSSAPADGAPQRPAQPAPAARVAQVPAALPRVSTPRSEADRARSAEISGANLRAADVDRLRQLGFQVIRSRTITILGNTLVIRFRTPRQFSPRQAIEIAREVAPQAVFDFSHLYAPGQSGAVPDAGPIYARALVQLASVGQCASGVRVGLIDTAVARHASLQGANITRKSFSEGRASASHGTAVASILVGRDPSGRALLPGVRLFAASVFSQGSESLVADAIDLVAAIDWMVQSGVRVVNVSITGPANALLETAVAAATSRGLIIVAAGGNNTAGGTPRYPAALSAVIAVSAVDRRGRAYAYNTRGAYIDISAPGVDVWGANSGGGAALWSGTSFAAPFVTAELAIAVGRGALGDAQSASRHLARNARDLGPKGRDPVYGHGLLQGTGC